MTNPVGLYLHIPFCERKCNYCDFYSAFVTEAAIDRYCDGLMGLIKQWGGKFNRPIDTIYLGGGTPSLLEHRLPHVLETVKSVFNVLPDAEVTLELNPAGRVDEILDFAIRAGVNRLSIGAQSADDSELKILGRIHTAQDTVKTVEKAREKGFNNISLDIMLGLPDSDCETLKRSLSFITDLEPEHISAYLLKIEERTVFHRKQTDLNLPDDDGQAKQYLLMCEHFEKAGYRHYEISNFCKDGKFSRHNIKYWLGDEYLGLGPSAHSMVDGKRFYYPRNMLKAMDGTPPVADGNGGGHEEYVMLRLRLDTGIDTEEYEEKFEKKLPQDFFDYCYRFQKAGYLNMEKTNISLTKEGMLLSNSIISELLDCLE